MVPGHGDLQSALDGLGILRALGLESSQDAGDIVLAGVEALAQGSSSGQGGEGEDDGATHFESFWVVEEHSSIRPTG